MDHSPLVLGTDRFPVYQMSMNLFVPSGWAIATILVLVSLPVQSADTFRVGAYNVENYLDVAGNGREAKPQKAKDKVHESIRALNADVLALVEMGTTNALLELRASLKNQGLDYPHWEHVAGADPAIHVAVLSKVPFTARRPHTNESFLLSGKRHRVGRGFVEVDVKVSDNYSFTLMAAHLKSKRPVPEGDEAELRLEEAKLLREKIDARLTANPNCNLVVLGDFNDTKDAQPIRTLIGGRGKPTLVDTRPAEKNGDTDPNPITRYEPRNVTWTHYYGKEDSYSRIDYILVSKGMENERLSNETYILTVPNWGTGSDHRPIVATFSTQDK